MKFKGYILGMVVTSMLGFGTISVTSGQIQASSWHKGTPYTFRGYYYFGKGKNNPGRGFGSYVRVLPKSFDYQASGMPWVNIVNTKYKKVGKYYYVHGYGKSNGFYKGGSTTYRFAKKGKHILICSRYDGKYSNLEADSGVKISYSAFKNGRYSY